MTIALYQDLFAAVALLPFVLQEEFTLTAKDVMLLAMLGIVCTAVAHSLFIAGMHRISARTASTIACLEPVYGALLAAILFREIPTLRTVVGGCIVLGVALYATIRTP
jgi:drug/metabolite transporter (DMT)-like permease